MSELVAPWSQHHTFLTLNKYNADKERIPCEVSITRDQPFIHASERLYVAAESWRLSAGLGEGGLVYNYIQPTWFIEAETQTHQLTEVLDVVGTVDEGNGGDYKAVNVALRAESGLKSASGKKMRLSLVAVQPQGQTNSVQGVVENLMKVCNSVTGVAGDIIRLGPMPIGDGTYVSPDFFLLDTIIESVVGPGIGVRGLYDFVIEINNIQVIGTNASNKNIGSMVVKVLHVDNPLITLTEEFVRKHFSSALNFYTQQFSTTESKWSSIAPHGMKTATLGLNPNFYQIAAASGTEFKIGDEVRYKESPQGAWKVTTVTELPANWVQPIADGSGFSVEVTMTEQQATEGGNLVKYFAYVSEEGDDFDGSIKCDVEVTPLAALGHTEFQDEQFGVSLISENAKIRTIIRKHPAEGGVPVPVYTPNDLYRRFNPDENAENDFKLWQLQSSPNGGFGVEVKAHVKDLRISADMVEALGLQTVAYYPDVDASTSNFGHKFVLRRVENQWPFADLYDPLADITFSVVSANPIVCEEVVANSAVDITFHECDIFGSIDETHLAEIFGRVDANHFIRYNDNYYKLIGLAQNKGTTIRTADRYIKGTYEYDDFGIAYWNYKGLPPGAEIRSVGELTVESFALFSGIQIISVSGLIVDPMVTSWSTGERVISEIRLGTYWNANALSSGETGSTTSEFVGDIRWDANRPQYLGVRSHISIYSMKFRAQAIFRNANAIPPKNLSLSQSGMFELKLRFLTVK